MSLIQLSPEILPEIVTRLNSLECEMRTLKEMSSKQTALIEAQTALIIDLKIIIANQSRQCDEPSVSKDPGSGPARNGSVRTRKLSPVKESLKLTPQSRRVEKPVNVSSPPAVFDSNIDADPTGQRATRQKRRSERNNILIFSPNLKTQAPSAQAPASDANQRDDQKSDLQGSTTESSQPTGEKWKEVRRTKPRPSLSMRCLAGPAVTSLKAAEMRKYIHLWNMLSGAEDVKQYLNELCPQKVCTVQELNTTNNYKSFKIGVPEECFDRCFSVNIWPENARVKKWVNYKRREPDNRTFRREVGE